MWIYSSKKAQIFILFFPTFLLLSVLLCHNLVIVTRDLLKTILLPKGNIFSIITKTSLKYRIDVHLRCKILFSFWCNFSICILSKLHLNVVRFLNIVRFAILSEFGKFSITYLQFQFCPIYNFDVVQFFNFVQAFNFLILPIFFSFFNFS